MVPETRYARSGDVNIAYQVLGDGPRDLVFVMGLPTVYQAGFLAAEDGLKAAPDLSMAQATLRRRSATERRARPWL